MFKIRTLFAAVAMLATQHVLADTAPVIPITPTNAAVINPCAAIADACTKAGYNSNDAAPKDIWDGCMKPILVGKPVANLTIDPKVAKACRVQKIQDLKTELKDIQAAQ